MSVQEFVLSGIKSRIRSLSCLIPRRRDAKGNPLPRRHVYTRPVVTAAPETLLKVASVAGRSKEEAYSLYPLLKAEAAVGADENAAAVREKLEADLERRQGAAREELTEVKAAVCESRSRIRRLCTQLAFLTAGLGLSAAEDLQLGGDLPVSLEVIAGREGLCPPGEVGRSWGRSALKALAAVGSGTLVGLSLGLLTGKLSLTDITDEYLSLAFWAALGISIMMLIGAALGSLARSAGSLVYPYLSSAPARRINLFAQLAVLGLLAAAFVLIESRIEQLGILRSVTEAHTFVAPELSAGDYFWVSLLASLPAVCCYVITGYLEGFRVANQAKLLSLQEYDRQHLRQNPRYAIALALAEELRGARDEEAHLLSRERELEAQVSERLSLHDCQRIEDLEHEAAGAAWEAEEALRPRRDGRKTGLLARVGYWLAGERS